MSSNDLLTVKEFANIAGVSVQSIYKGLNNRLNPWVELVDNQKMLNPLALEEFYGIKVEQPIKPKLNNQFNPKKDDEIQFLRQQIEQLQDELTREREHNRKKDEQLFDTLSKLADAQVALSAGSAADKQKALAEKLIEGKTLNDAGCEIGEMPLQKKEPIKKTGIFKKLFGKKD